MDFNKLNQHLYDNSAPHRFAKKPTDLDRGYLKMSDWLSDLCYYYEKKRQAQELADENEFKALIQAHREKIEALSESIYKEGLMKAIDEL